MLVCRENGPLLHFSKRSRDPHKKGEDTTDDTFDFGIRHDGAGRR